MSATAEPGNKADTRDATAQIVVHRASLRTSEQH